MQNLDPQIAREAKRAAEAYAFDAAETMLFSRALEHVKSRVARVRFEEMKAMRFVPFSTEAGPLKQFVKYRVLEQYLAAKWYSRNMTNIPVVNAVMREYGVEFKSIVSGYTYSYDDAKIAAAEGSEYLAVLADTARMAIDLGIDEAVALGNPETNMTGLINHPNLPLVTVPNGNWTTSTSAADMLEDLLYLDTVVGVATSDILQADTLLLPPSAMRLAQGALLGAEFSSNVLNKFLQQAQNIKSVDSWNRLSTAAADGGGRVIVYKRDPTVVEAEIGVLFEQLPGQVQGMNTVVPVRAKIAGVNWHQPKGGAGCDNLV